MRGANLTIGNSNIDIGNSGAPGQSSAIRIGKPGDHTNTYIAGISGVTVAGGLGVVIDTSGHLGTVTSSAHYKEAIRPMGDASEEILALKPVSFRYKKELDPAAIPQFGLVAEDVEKVSPELVAHDAEGKPYSVRYEAVNAMLLNEFLKAHRQLEEQAQKNEKQEATIAALEEQVRNLAAAVKERAAQMQEVDRRQLRRGAAAANSARPREEAEL